MFCCFTTRLVRAFDDDGEVDEGVGCDRDVRRDESRAEPRPHTPLARVSVMTTLFSFALAWVSPGSRPP